MAPHGSMATRGSRNANVVKITSNSWTKPPESGQCMMTTVVVTSGTHGPGASTRFPWQSGQVPIINCASPPAGVPVTQAFKFQGRRWQPLASWLVWLQVVWLVLLVWSGRFRLMPSGPRVVCAGWHVPGSCLEHSRQPVQSCRGNPLDGLDSPGGYFT